MSLIPAAPVQAKRSLRWDEVHALAQAAITEYTYHVSGLRLYGVPRGGIYAAQAMSKYARDSIIVENAEDADIIIDDIIDSGHTRDAHQHHMVPFISLVDKTKSHADWGWVEFPWERAQSDLGVEDNIRRILQYIGEDPDREGLQGTPKRVARAYGEMFAGYKQDPEDVITTFEDGSCDEMVLLKDIEFTSYCEHHMLPFRGKAHIAYIPKGRVIGISKLARILDIYCARLQIQERIGSQVTDAISKHLSPLGSACIVEAHHQCMSCRGVRKQNSVMVTSSLRGVFRDDSAARQELFSLIRS